MVSLETWEKSEGLDKALDALRAKAREAAALETAGIKTQIQAAAFQKLTDEKHVLGLKVSECQTAREEVEASVPANLREARGRAEALARKAGGEAEARRRSYSAQESLVDRMLADVGTRGTHAHDLQTAKDALVVRANELKTAESKHRQALEEVARAAALAKPKKPKV